MNDFIRRVDLTLFFTLCVGLVIGKRTASESFIDSTDASGLLAFKGTISDPKGYLSGWNISLQCNSNYGWRGVRCNKSGKVTVINLSWFKLSGKVLGSTSLGWNALSKLQALILSNNNFTGTIPNSISQFNSLRILDLSNNALSGGLPGGLQLLSPNLNFLDLSFNKLSSTFPAWLGQAKKLATLNLAKNDFWGELPDLSGLSSLRNLNLRSNFFKGTLPSSLVNVSNLVTIDISRNFFSRRLPGEIGSLKNLQRLNFAHNYFAGFLPQTFASQTLWKADFSNNYFSGPPSVSNKEGELPLAGSNSSTGLLLGANCLDLTNCPGCPYNQRPDSECSNFCDSKQELGSCGDKGWCWWDNNGKGFCTCDSGFVTSATGKTCISAVTRSTGVTFPNITRPQFLSRTFRHMSATHVNSASGVPKWSVVFSWNWAEEFSGWDIRDQEKCFGCWAFSVVGAVEAAAAITYASKTPPRLSETQILSCAGSSGCSGGWPVDALEYASQNVLVTASQYKGGCPSKSANGYRVIFYEEVKFIGWFGLLLAVQQQPVVVFLDGTSPEFVQYTGGVLDSPTCFSNGLNHAVLIVGYNLGGTVPYWVVRNSWGESWGERGYMRLAISGGNGVCGVNIFPGFYPVMDNSWDKCNKVNFGVSVLKNIRSQPGTISPCGRYDCSTWNSKAWCGCTAPFSVATDLSGSQVCILSNPCAYFPSNPCGTGTCVDTSAGGYTCMCPFGYGLTTFALDNSPTCAPASTVIGIQSYYAPAGTSIDCTLVAGVYGIILSQFERQNPSLDCSVPILGETKINVTSNVGGCSLSYGVNQGDTCTSISNLFSLSSLVLTNPSLDCGKLVSGQQVCIVRGSNPDVPICTSPHVMEYSIDGTATETCTTIINDYFKGDAYAFFRLNPGLYCDRLRAPTQIQNIPPVQTVCLQGTSMGSILSSCYLGKFAITRSGDTCAKFYAQYFFGSAWNYRRANRNIPCRDSKLYIGFPFCIKWP